MVILFCMVAGAVDIALHGHLEFKRCSRLFWGHKRETSSSYPGTSEGILRYPAVWSHTIITKRIGLMPEPC